MPSMCPIRSNPGDGLGAHKFFYGPDVVATKSFTAVMMGSCDREKPLKTSGDDAFYLIKDTRLSKGAPPGAISAVLAADLAAVGSSSASELPLFCKPTRSQVLVEGGLPPSPVVDVIQLSTIPAKRRRPYWYTETGR